MEVVCAITSTNFVCLSVRQLAVALSDLKETQKPTSSKGADSTAAKTKIFPPLLSTLFVCVMDALLAEEAESDGEESDSDGDEIGSKVCEPFGRREYEPASGAKRSEQQAKRAREQLEKLF